MLSVLSHTHTRACTLDTHDAEILAHGPQTSHRLLWADKDAVVFSFLDTWYIHTSTLSTTSKFHLCCSITPSGPNSGSNSAQTHTYTHADTKDGHCGEKKISRPKMLLGSPGRKTESVPVEPPATHTRSTAGGCSLSWEQMWNIIGTPSRLGSATSPSRARSCDFTLRASLF